MKTPVASPQKTFKNHSTPNQGSPSKPIITPDVRARIESNRKKALERKAEVSKISESQEDGRIVAEKRAAGTLEATEKQAAGDSSLRGLASDPSHDQENVISIDSDLDDLTDEDLPGFGYSEPEAVFTPDARCSPEQLRVLELVKLGRNVFFTGSAGVGKSFMLQEIVRMLRSKSFNLRVSITAPTGIAALAVGGCTIYSWAKVGLGKGSVHELYNKLMLKNSKRVKYSPHDASERPGMQDTDVLIVDEVSMLPPELFEKISILCKALRHVDRPYGGIQLILSGDFFQLPPVLKDEDFTCMYCGCPKLERNKSTGLIKCVRPLHKNWDRKPCGRERKEFTFCFETPTWRELNLEVIELQKVFRQEDKSFIDVLNKIRRGIVDDEVGETMNSCTKPLVEHQVKPTRLYARNFNVDAENTKQFRLLRSEAHTFTALDEVLGNAPYAQAFKPRLDDLQARKSLTLKIDTQVMLIANLNVAEKLVNGSRGVIVDWEERPTPVLSGVLGSKRQKPEDTSRISWCYKQQDKLLPRVKFTDGRIRTIEPYTWDIEIDKHLTLTRTQLPLSLAWALTIHKSQGQTIDRLCVDLSGVFENGQAYVALSRARTLDGLQVKDWRTQRVKAHPTVQEFYNSLSSGKAFDDPTVSFLQKDDFFPYSEASSPRSYHHNLPAQILYDGLALPIDPILPNSPVLSESPSLTHTLKQPSFILPPGTITYPSLPDTSNLDPVLYRSSLSTPSITSAFHDEESLAEVERATCTQDNKPKLESDVKPDYMLAHDNRTVITHDEKLTPTPKNEDRELTPRPPQPRQSSETMLNTYTSQIEEAINQLSQSLQQLPIDEAQWFDLESLVEHTTMVVKSRFSNCRL